jgi:hypothetical protein
VGAHDNFDSHFMTDFMDGKTSVYRVSEPLLFYEHLEGNGGSGDDYTSCPSPREFSEAARNVFNAGRELWRYYHKQPDVNVNASLYDIRQHFQGRNDQGKMNSKSDDETYNELIGHLRSELRILAMKIEPKVYAYGFLKE